jgi:lipid A disaccharide synthetase
VKEAKRVRPRGVVMVDYPGFNLRFAKALWKLGIPVVWYISPQVWVWRKGNIKKLAKYCKKMLVIFPFEPEVYEGSGLDAEFVGHPLVEIVQERTVPGIERDPNCFLLLPGSRSGEVSRLLEPMLDTVCELHKTHPQLYFVIAASREKMRIFPLSARTGEGCEELRQGLLRHFAGEYEKTVLIPYHDGETLAALYRDRVILNREDTEEGIRITYCTTREENQ